jgi:glutamate---cysteine ligase / carboxylate-amine ligase
MADTGTDAASPTLDRERTREAFEASTDFTVGLEEEFALLDPETLELVPAFEILREAGMADPVLAESISGELISSEIEIRSGGGADIADALGRQADARRRLFHLAARHGVALGSTGTHPLSDYRDQHIIDTDHYHRVEDGLKYVAWRNNTFSLHVHVGVQGPDRAVRVCDRLRPVLPLLLALSANSPYVDCRDSGLHSARTQTFTKSFPRCGVPDAFGSWAAWEEYVDLLIRTGSIVEFTQLWWSVRPHHSFGTVEVRVCDAQATGPESDALATLIAACVAQAAREVDAGETPPDLPGRLIEENMWRAIRYGLDGRMLDLEARRIEEYPANEIVDRLRAWTGADVSFADLNGAQRQRRAIDAGATPAEVYSETVRATQATFYEHDEETVP